MTEKQKLLQDSYDLQTKRGMILFNNDCIAAAGECPQFVEHCNPLDVTWGNKEVSIGKLYLYWRNSILYTLGYSRYLSDTAINTFARYRKDIYTDVLTDIVTGKEVTIKTILFEQGID